MEIYQPAEDSFLMSRTLGLKIPELLNKNPDLKFLEIGCGSGINLASAESSGVNRNNILGSDINVNAIKNCRQLGFNCIKSDLFDNISKQNFDLIIFNPPYLPLDEKEPLGSQTATTGGAKGNEIAIRFLKQAKNYLDENGKILLIVSSLSPKMHFDRLGYGFREISSEKLFFENLSLFELKSIQ